MKLKVHTVLTTSRSCSNSVHVKPSGLAIYCQGWDVYEHKNLGAFLIIYCLPWRLCLHTIIASLAGIFHRNLLGKDSLRLWHEVCICSASSKAWISCLSPIPLCLVQTISLGGNIVITSSRTLQCFSLLHWTFVSFSCQLIQPMQNRTQRRRSGHWWTSFMHIVLRLAMVGTSLRLLQFTWTLFFSSHTYSTLTHISHAYDSSLSHLLHYDSLPLFVLLLYIRLDTYL